MDNIIEQILIGSILGDGSIGKHGYYHEVHCEKQKDYILWKRKIFNKEFKTKTTFRKPQKNGWTKQNQITLTIPKKIQTNPEKYLFFKEYRKLAYPNGKKSITNEFIKRIGKLAIVIWYFDDGSYNSYKNGIQIHSLCFLLEENKMLQRRLKDFGLNFRIGCCHSRKTDYPYYLFCYGKETDNFLKFIKENAIYIPKSMRYKMGKFHKGNLKLIEEKRKTLKLQRHNYRQINKERLKGTDHKYYMENKIRLNKRMKEYYQNNKDKWKIYIEKRRQHPEKLKEMFHNYYIKNKKRIRIRDLKKINERLKNGLCVHCGKKNDSKKSRYSCAECCNKKNIRDRNRRRKQRECG